MRTDWRYESDERTAAVYRDAFGMPRLPQPRERPSRAESALVALTALALALAIAWGAGL